MVKILMRADTHLHINQVIKEDAKEEEQIKTYFTWSQVITFERDFEFKNLLMVPTVLQSHPLCCKAAYKMIYILKYIHYLDTKL